MSDEDTFKPISAEVGEVLTLPSICMQCREEGETRVMFTKVPHFREITVSSFACEHCGERNTDVKFAGSMQPWGVKLDLKVVEKEDLDRQLVKSEYATISIPELDFTIPAELAILTTVEGIIQTAHDNLMMYQPLRRATDPGMGEKVDEFLTNLSEYRSLQKGPFHIKIVDPSGNSFIQNPHYPRPDPHLSVDRYHRSVKDNKFLALLPDDAPDDEDGQYGHDRPDMAYNTKRAERDEQGIEDGGVPDSYELPDECYGCGREGSMKFAMVNIPHFKEVILMSFKCDFCGYKTNEVKTGGAISEKGSHYELKVENEEDLARDVLKSTTCYVQIKEIDFECSEGTLGSMFTTVEGLIQQMYDQLKGVQQGGFHIGDSSTADDRGAFRDVLQRLLGMKEGKEPFTLVLDDPLSHSYLQSTADKPEDDRKLVKTEYVRTAEQDEDLGIDILRCTEDDYAGIPKPAEMQHNTSGVANAARSKELFHNRKVGAPMKYTPEFDEEYRALKLGFAAAADSKEKFNLRNADVPESKS